MGFSDTKEIGKKSGVAFSKGLSKLGYFLLVVCLINPFCHLSSFVDGFSEGFKGGR